MKTQPKFRKYIKPHRPKINPNFRQQKVLSSERPVFSLISLDSKLLTIGQIEAARRIIVRALKVKKTSRFLIRVSPTHPRTQRPLETRMGSGKGAVDHWVAPVRAGSIIFEITKADSKTVLEAFKKANYKLPGRFKVVEEI